MMHVSHNLIFDAYIYLAVCLKGGVVSKYENLMET